MQNAFTVSQILTSVEEIIPITWMLHGWAPLDHMYMNVTLEILEIDKTAQANLISIQNIHDIFDYSAALTARLMPLKWTNAIRMHLAIIPRAHTNVLAILRILGMVLIVKIRLVFYMHEGDEIYILFPMLNVAVYCLELTFIRNSHRRQRKFSRNYCPTIVKFCLFKQHYPYMFMHGVAMIYIRFFSEPSC